MIWSAKHDYAIAFGAALGMTTEQIGECIGTNKNAVIGRAHRRQIALLSVGGRRGQARPKKIPKRERRDGIIPLGVAARAAGLTVKDLIAFADAEKWLQK